MSICTESTTGPREPVLQVLVAARVFVGQRVNLQEKYDYPLQSLFQLVGRAVPEALDQGLAEAATDGRAQLRHLATEPGAAALHAFEALLHRFAGAGRQRRRTT